MKKPRTWRGHVVAAENPPLTAWIRPGAPYLSGMTHMPMHRRLREMRDQAIRRPAYRVVYSHALTIAHMDGRLIADDHPSWDRIDRALAAARAGDPDALDTIEREFSRLRDKASN